MSTFGVLEDERRLTNPVLVSRTVALGARRAGSLLSGLSGSVSVASYHAPPPKIDEATRRPMLRGSI